MRAFSPVIVSLAVLGLACFPDPKQQARLFDPPDGASQTGGRTASDAAGAPGSGAAEVDTGGGNPGSDGMQADAGPPGGEDGPASPGSPSPDAAAPTSPAVCGNGVVERGEQCDPPSSCPTACPNRGCSLFALEGSAAACTARCLDRGMQTMCAAGDGCCPSGCNASNDSDCSVVCGNGVREGKETCDPLSSCPKDCPAQGCQLRRLVNQGTCAAECVNDRQQIVCQPGDACCPDGCNANLDSDCTPKCGNGVVEAGETCDPRSACETRRSACTGTRDIVRTGSGDPARCTFQCTETRRPCGPADGQCPSNCDAPADPDCRRTDGSACNTGGQCLSTFCVNAVCCDRACNAPCEECSGGTCRSRCQANETCRGDTCVPNCMSGADCSGRNPTPACFPGITVCSPDGASRCVDDTARPKCDPKFGCAMSANRCRVCDPTAAGTCASPKQLQGCNPDGTSLVVTTCSDACAPTGIDQNVPACCGARGEPCCFDADCNSVGGLACDRIVLGSNGDSHRCVDAIPLGSACMSGGTPCQGNGHCVDGVCCNRGVSSSCPGGALCNASGNCP